MKDTNIFLIDLNPTTNVGCTLREIIESCTKLNAFVLYESSGSSQSFPIDRELTNAITRRQLDLIIITLSSCTLEQARELIQSIRKKFSVLPIIFIAEKCKPDEMFFLLKLGATDYITPPIENMEILPRLWRLLEHKQAQNTLTYRLKEKIVAKCDANVMIVGETGTGKELCARAIHYLSPRASRPFIPFNCGAIPTELMENELFGHVQGAFTGAATAQPGLISVADSGTLFLDDIDSLSPSSQAKLLRFLQEKEYRQLGSAKMFQADVRVIAATNSDLEAALDEGKFRRDLYYRLNVIRLALPALRDRRDDIPLLALHFMHKYANAFEKKIAGFAEDAMKTMMLYDWPGNVRELEHVVQRAALFCEHKLIRETDVDLPSRKAAACKMSFKDAKAHVVNKFERSYLETLLVSYQGNITRAAQAAQKNRRAFWQLIRKHEIDVQSFKHG
ncbi:MAG: sigma-54 dependent transcriptional regulator [Desulfobacterales bacterium]